MFGVFFSSTFLTKDTQCSSLTSFLRLKNKISSLCLHNLQEINLMTLRLLPQANHCLELCFRGLQIEDRLNEPGVIRAPRVLHFAPINCVCRGVKVQGSIAVRRVCRKYSLLCTQVPLPPRFSFFPYLPGRSQALSLRIPSFETGDISLIGIRPV